MLYYGCQEEPMLDTVQIPILLKAIDFVFEEGRKILEERRERRKASANPPEVSQPQAPEAKSLMLQVPEKAVEVKRDLLSAKVNENIWQNNEAEVRHLVRLLEIYSNNYHLASEQYARWGSALVPPIVVNNMTEAENAFLETAGQLEALLSKIYDKDAGSSRGA
jgi:hypothetical protein